MKHLIQFIYTYPKGCKHSSLPDDYVPSETFQVSELAFSNYPPNLRQMRPCDGLFWTVNSMATYVPKLIPESRTKQFHLAVCHQFSTEPEPIAPVGDSSILTIPILRSGDFPLNEDGSNCSMWVKSPDYVPKVGGRPYEDAPLVVDEVQWFEPLNANSLHVYPQVAVCWCLDASPVLAG